VPKKNNKLVNITTFAEHHGIGRNTVTRMMKEGRLEVYTINGKKLLRLAQKPKLKRK